MADSPLRPRSSYIPPAGVDPLRPSGDLFFEEDLVRATLPETADARRGLAQAFAAAASGHHSGAALKAEAAGDAALQQQALRQAELADRQAELYAPRVSSLRDAQSIGDVGSFIAGAAPGVVADTLPALGAALLTRGRWKPAAFAGATVPSYHQQFGEMAREQRLDPTLSEASAEDRLRSARLGAAGGSLLEALLPGKLANEALRGSSRSLLRNTAVDALTEGVTETAQTGVQHLAHRTIDPTRELDGWDLVDSAVGGAAGGGGLGAASRAPSHVANALFGRARPVRNDAGDPQPGADVAPPGTPLLPAPDGGSGGGVGGLYDTLNERFGDGIRDRARKTKDYVSDTIDRMGEAAKTAETPQDFLRQVFGNSAEEAAADLRPDTEDPVVLNAPDPAAALQQRDAQRQERAALFAAELLNDPATPESVKERVASFGGDFSNPEAQAFVARNLVAQRAGEKLANAVGDLFDLTKDFGGKAAETGTDLASKARDMIDKSMSAATDRIVKKNLQGINEADVAPLVRLLAQRLGPALAGDAPKLARQLVAAANRLSPDARITEETDRRLRNFSAAIDDEVLDLVTELSGSDALRNTIAKIRSIPSAASDVRQSGGYSFLESMLKQPLEPAVLSQLSEFVDALGLQLGSMSSERKNQVLAALALAFGSKREAQIVVEYYGNIRRDALRRAAERGDYGPDADVGDDATEDSSYQLESADAVEGDNYEGDNTAASKAEWGALSENDGPKTQYGFRESKSKRPFRKFVGETLSDGRTRREAVRAVVDSRGREDMNYGFVDYADYLAENNITPEQGVEERKRDIEGLIKGHLARKDEDRSSSINALRGELQLLERAVADYGAKGALNRLYEVTSRAERGDEDLSASDDDLRAMKTKVRLNTRGMTKYQRKVATEKHNRTLLDFVDADGKYLTLSAPSMVATLGSKRGKMGKVVESSEQKDSDTLKDAIASVIARGYTLVSDLNEVALTPDGPAVFAGRSKERRGLVSAQGGKRIAEARALAEKRLKRLEAAIDRAGDPADAGYSARLEEKTRRVMLEIEHAAETDVADRTEARRAKEEALERWRENEMPDKGALWASYVGKRTAFDIATDLAQISTDAKYSATSLMREARNEVEALERSGSTVEDRSGEIARGQENRRLERQRADLVAELNDAISADDLLLQTRIRARLEQNAKALAKLQEQEVKERAQSGAGRLLEEKAPKNWVPDTPPASKPRSSNLRTDAILAANPELLTVLDGYGEPKDPKWSESAIRERVYDAYRKLPITALKTRLENLRKQYREALASKNRGAQQEAATIKYIGELINSVLAARGAKEGRPGPGTRTPEKTNVWASSGENRELSNLAPRPFDFEGRHYFSVEHAYQTLKSGEFDRATYAKYSSGGYQKIPGRRAKTDGGYNIKLMERLMAASFQQNPGAMDALRKTGRAEITHVQDRGIWRDEFPRILMEIRDAGRAGSQSASSTGRRVVLPSTSPYTAKDQAKSDRANKFIGRGAPGSSTAAYAEAWGDRANTGVYASDDTVFISVNGNRRGALTPPWAEIKKAMSAGATLITDTPADRARNFNTGERAVADFLSSNGYVESAPGTWTPRNAPKSSQGKVVKKSFVGAKADPEGAARAQKALGEAVVGDKPDATAADIDAATTRAELMYMLRHRRIPQSLFARFRQRSEDINSRVQGAAQAELRQSMVDGGIRKYVRVGFAEVLEQAESVKDAKNAYDALIGLQGFLPPALREIADKYLSGFKAELEGTKFSLRDRRTGLPNALSEHVLAEFSMGGDIELTVIGRHIAEEAYVRAMGEPRSGISPAYAVLHEITHALTVLREATDPVFRAETRRLYDATAKALTREQSEKFVYAMADTQEFLAEAMANPAFREVLRGIRDSGKSVLDRLMDAVRKTLGLRQSEQSLLSSVEELVYGQPPVSASVTKKNSFVGAKADPQGAADAEGLLRVGAPADVVWRELGWFRGPDGKLRKEIRSPVLRRRVRELATAIANGSRDAVAVSDLLAGIDAFKPYLAELGDLPVDPNDGMVELMGAVGAYNAEDGFSSRGIGISRLNAELAVRADAVPGGKGTALIREIVGNLNPPELADTGLSFVDPTDIIAELEARHPMPDVNERVTEYLTGTILHELQHAFQHVEGFENGGNATTAVIAKYGDVDEYLAAVRDGDEGTVERITEQAFAQLRAEVGPDGDMEAAAHELYESIVGEVEANDVAARMNLSDEEARTVAPALTDAKREFVRSVLLAEALSAVRGLHSATSKVGGRPGRPGKNWGDKAAVKAEILRLRGKDVKVRIEKLVKDLGGSGQYTYDRATGERLIEVAINAASPLGTARHEAMHDLFRFLSKDPATRSIAKDLRDATSAPHVITRLRELLKDHKGALEQLSDPEERAAYAYQFWAEGLLRIGPTGTGVFHTIRKFLKDLFGIVTAGQRGEDLMRAFHDGKFADPSTVQEVLQDLNDANGDRLRNKMERAAPALVKATRAVFTPAVDRLRSFENDSLNELADKFFSDTGRSGFIQNKYQQEGVWMNRLAALLRGTTAAERREAIEQLQAMAPKSPLAKALAKYNKDIYEYMRDAGVKSWDSQKKAFVPLREVQNYFTRSWDADAIARNRAEFEALLRKEGGVSATNAAALADNLARGTEARPGPKEEGVDLGYMPYAPHTSERVLTFINQSNAQAFAKFQHKDLADIMTMYTRSAVHRAEYAREFGNNGERIVALVKSSGVRGKDALTEISNSVQALEGSLDPGKWSPETKQFMAGMQTLQNVVVLPLALASQMIDPIVLAARSGDIRDAGRAYATALLRLKNTITKSNDGVVGEDLAKILGIVSEDSTLQAMAMAYGTTRMSKRMEAINRVFFRYNGMQGWNDSMRIAATAAGERYLLANKRNAAALAELDLTSKDIKVDKNGRLDVSSPKVQQAMFRFVDQAVLRPSPAQRPVWMSDPRFLLVAHLKQFTFAMHNVVLKRANRELSAGNPKPWATLMLAMPVMLAADMAKFALTGSFPSTWGFKDYLMHAVERSGLLGLGDFGVQAMSGVGMGKAPGEELLGPSFEHLMELLRWIGGDPRTDFGDVIDRTVPGARFI